MVTLFELTVINNWFIIMEGFTSVMINGRGVLEGHMTRLFFMSFYLMIMVRLDSKI